MKAFSIIGVSQSVTNDQSQSSEIHYDKLISSIIFTKTSVQFSQFD